MRQREASQARVRFELRCHRRRVGYFTHVYCTFTDSESSSTLILKSFESRFSLGFQGTAPFHRTHREKSRENLLPLSLLSAVSPSLQWLKQRRIERPPRDEHDAIVPATGSSLWTGAEARCQLTYSSLCGKCGFLAE